MPRRQNYTDEKVKILQANLSAIRSIADWTAEDLGQKIGVSKQTISNLENSDGRSNVMSPTQYIAIRAIIDDEIGSSPNPILGEAMKRLFDEKQERGHEDNLNEIRDVKVAQLGAATKAAIASQPKSSRDSELAKAIALAALMPLVGSILGVTLASKSSYQLFAFLKDAPKK